MVQTRCYGWQTDLGTKRIDYQGATAVINVNIWVVLLNHPAKVAALTL